MTPFLALQLATQAHLGQVDKLGNDYISHPTRVAAKFDDPDLQSVSYMHDVLEDSSVTEEELRELFSPHVVDAVVAITKKERQHYADYLKQVKANEMALAVKLADIDDNVNRLDQLTDLETKERLSGKYQHALRVLLDESDSDKSTAITSPQEIVSTVSLPKDYGTLKWWQDVEDESFDKMVRRDKEQNSQSKI